MEFINLLPSQAKLLPAEALAQLPRHYFYQTDAARQLAQALAAEVGSAEVLLVCDANTRQAAGINCAAELSRAGLKVRELILPKNAKGGDPVCDDLTLDSLKKQLGPKPGFAAIVAAGAGVVNDLSKWLAAEYGIFYAVFATGASMNGYTAANVAPTIKGVKCLFRAKAPRIVAADPAVLAAAPARLAASGLGDVIAKPVSTADWLLNHVIFGEKYSDTIAEIISAVEPRYMENPSALARQDPAAIQGLFEALILSGAAMTLQGSSLPASGGEHLVSHSLDMMSSIDSQPHDLHGRQVGVATIIAAALYMRLFAQDSPPWRASFISLDAAFWGDIAPAVSKELSQKQEKLDKVREWLQSASNWDRLRHRLTPILRSPESIKKCLKQAGAAHCLADIGCSRARFLAAVHHCTDIRARITIMDLAHLSGILPNAAEELVDSWVTQ